VIAPEDPGVSLERDPEDLEVSLVRAPGDWEDDLMDLLRRQE
jgi:hypothetical protein